MRKINNRTKRNKQKRGRFHETWSMVNPEDNVLQDIIHLEIFVCPFPRGNEYKKWLLESEPEKGRYRKKMSQR